MGKYLDYENCKCRKRLADKLVEECIENINEKELHSSEMIYNSILNDYEKICSSCTVYIVLFIIFFIISISISGVFIYFYWYLKVVSATFLLVCFLYLNDSTCQITKKCFLFHLKSSYCSWENQILEFYIFKFCNVIKCLSMKQVIHFTE